MGGETVRKTGSLDRHYHENGDILGQINVGDTEVCRYEQGKR